ncbi:MAG TPA: hypothetical protein VG603_08600, partial [Chitinophagales bacterium]|nr:hypothetical protein [Chitinophagales bacterium]
YSAKNVGLMMVSNSTAAPDGKDLDKIIADNLGLNLRKQFNIEGKGIIGYRLNSPKCKWVICTIKGQKTDRKFDKWKRLNVIN